MRRWGKLAWLLRIRLLYFFAFLLGKLMAITTLRKGSSEVVLSTPSTIFAFFLAQWWLQHVFLGIDIFEHGLIQEHDPVETTVRVTRLVVAATFIQDTPIVHPEVVVVLTFPSIGVINCGREGFISLAGIASVRIWIQFIGKVEVLSTLDYTVEHFRLIKMLLLLVGMSIVWLGIFHLFIFLRIFGFLMGPFLWGMGFSLLAPLFLIMAHLRSCWYRLLLWIECSCRFSCISEYIVLLFIRLKAHWRCNYQRLLLLLLDRR